MSRSVPLIKDQAVVGDIRNAWTGVELNLGRAKRALAGAGGSSGGGAVIFAADLMNNIPFLLACSVLNDVLSALRDEGRFTSKRRTLGALVQDSAGALRWNDVKTIEAIVGRRNELAHDTKIHKRADCWRDIEAIRSQLVLWGILEPTGVPPRIEQASH